jgi:hypothetical protein
MPKLGCHVTHDTKNCIYCSTHAAESTTLHRGTWKLSFIDAVGSPQVHTGDLDVAGIQEAVAISPSYSDTSFDQNERVRRQQLTRKGGRGANAQRKDRVRHAANVR